MKTVFPSSADVFFNKFFILAGGNGFNVQCKQFLKFEIGNFVKRNLIPACGN